MNHLQYPDITSQVGLQENHFSSQTDPFATRLHFQSNNIADKLGHSIIPQVMNETCRYQLNTTLQNFDSMMRYNSIYINTKSDAATNVECFKDTHSADKKACLPFNNHLVDAKSLPKNYQKSGNDKFALNICSNKSNGISATVSSKSKFMIDVATMTDPLTPEEQERLCQWEGFAAVQSGNKVAEYLTGLREFLKVTIILNMMLIILKNYFQLALISTVSFWREFSKKHFCGSKVLKMWGFAEILFLAARIFQLYFVKFS